MQIISHENIFAVGNLELFYRSWLPETGSIASIVIVHGGGDHSGRFRNVVNFLVPEGYGIFIFDLRGHGKSPGKRGHIHSWDEYRKDLGVFLREIHNQHPALPLILFGHSMGGLIVLDYCLRDQHFIDGVIVTSPAIGELGISPFLFTLAKLLNRIMPSLVFPTGLVVPHLSRDREFIRETQSDPLYHSRSTPRFGMEMVKTIQYVHEHAGHFNLPLRLIHGTGDRIASIEGSRKLVQKINPRLLSYQEYENGYHELFNDLCKKAVLEDLLQWLNDQSS